MEDPRDPTSCSLFLARLLSFWPADSLYLSFRLTVPCSSVDHFLSELLGLSFLSHFGWSDFSRQDIVLVVCFLRGGSSFLCQLLVPLVPQLSLSLLGSSQVCAEPFCQLEGGLCVHSRPELPPPIAGPRDLLWLVARQLPLAWLLTSPASCCQLLSLSSTLVCFALLDFLVMLPLRRRTCMSGIDELTIVGCCAWAAEFAHLCVSSSP